MRNILFYVIALILAAHAAANYFFWYQNVFWLDIPMHMLGGMWLALAGAYLLFERVHEFEVKNFWAVLLPLLGVVSFIGIVWEFWEYFAYGILPSLSNAFIGHSGSLQDTLGDLFNDLIGASIGSLWAYFHYRRD